MIDGLFVVLVLVPIFLGTAYVAALATGTSDPAVAVALALIADLGLYELAYYLVGASHGQTIGKRMVGIRVCRLDDGRRIGFWRAVGRQFASLLSSLAFGIGWLAPLWTPRRQTWQDSMTGTVVIRDPNARLASAAVVWAVIWSLMFGGALGAGFGIWLKAMEDSGVTWELGSSAYSSSAYSDSGYSDSGYSDSGYSDSDYASDGCPELSTGSWSGSWSSDETSLSGDIRVEVDTSGSSFSGTVRLSSSDGSFHLSPMSMNGELDCGSATVSTVDDIFELDGIVSDDGEQFYGSYSASLSDGSVLDEGTFEINLDRY